MSNKTFRFSNNYKFGHNKKEGIVRKRLYDGRFSLQFLDSYIEKIVLLEKYSYISKTPIRFFNLVIISISK